MQRHLEKSHVDMDGLWAESVSTLCHTSIRPESTHRLGDTAELCVRGNPTCPSPQVHRYLQTRSQHEQSHCPWWQVRVSRINSKGSPSRGFLCCVCCCHKHWCWFGSYVVIRMVLNPYLQYPSWKPIPAQSQRSTLYHFCKDSKSSLLWLRVWRVESPSLSAGLSTSL